MKLLVNNQNFEASSTELYNFLTSHPETVVTSNRLRLYQNLGALLAELSSGNKEVYLAAEGLKVEIQIKSGDTASILEAFSISERFSDEEVYELYKETLNQNTDDSFLFDSLALAKRLKRLKATTRPDDKKLIIRIQLDAFN